MPTNEEKQVPYVAHRHVAPESQFQGTFAHYLISFTAKGGSEYRLPDSTIHIGAGDLLCFAPQAWQNWHVNNEQGWLVTWVVIDLPLGIKEILPEANLAPGISLIHLEGVDAQEVGQAFATMLSWQERPSPVRDRVILHQLAYALLICLGQSLPSEQDQRIRKARQFLRSRIETPTMLANICIATHLSRARLCALFKKELNTSPLQYLERLRMDEAARRLRFTADPINEIAKALTYQERKYFDKRFKRYWGVTPYAYRQSQIR